MRVSEWKIANVTPIYKTGSRYVVSNYRPVSLISVCCKVLEHIWYTSIVKHIEINAFFNQSLH